MHYAKWKERNTTTYIPYNYIYGKFLKKQNSSDKSRSVVTRIQRLNKKFDCKTIWGKFLGDGNVLYFIVVVVIWPCTLVKTHQISHIKLVNFIICKGYFNKADWTESKLEILCGWGLLTWNFELSFPNGKPSISLGMSYKWQYMEVFTATESP